MVAVASHLYSPWGHFLPAVTRACCVVGDWVFVCLVIPVVQLMWARWLGSAAWWAGTEAGAPGEERDGWALRHGGPAGRGAPRGKGARASRPHGLGTGFGLRASSSTGRVQASEVGMWSTREGRACPEEALAREAIKQNDHGTRLGIGNRRDRAPIDSSCHRVPVHDESASG